MKPVYHIQSWRTDKYSSLSELYHTCRTGNLADADKWKIAFAILVIFLILLSLSIRQFDTSPTQGWGKVGARLGKLAANPASI